MAVAVGAAWVLVLGVAASMAEPGCRTDLDFVVYAAFPMTVVLPALAAWAIRTRWAVVLVAGLVVTGLFNFFTIAVIAGNAGCFE